MAHSETAFSAADEHGFQYQQQIAHAAIQKEILRSRSLVLSYLLKLKKWIDAKHEDLVQALCTRFSEYLIDYISYGHFKIFEIYRPEPYHLTAVEHVTALALAFDERYRAQQYINLTTLRADLEELALAMEARFEIEDEVAILYH